MIPAARSTMTREMISCRSLAVIQGLSAYQIVKLYLAFLSPCRNI